MRRVRDRRHLRALFSALLASMVAACGSNGGGPGGQGGGGGGGGAGGAGALPANAKIMPLGDSITGSTCYRARLWDTLVMNGHAGLDFIGSRTGGGGCGVAMYDRDHEGHGGYIVSDVLKATSTGRPPGADASDPFVSSADDLATWLDGRPADAVLMQFGTNDVWNGIAPATILEAYSAIVARLRANNANVRMLVAQITPLAPDGCSACPTRVEALNGMIPAWATGNSTAASPITVVDQWTGFDVAADTSDRVHPNDSGSAKMAAKWYEALMPLL